MCVWFSKFVCVSVWLLVFRLYDSLYVRWNLGMGTNSQFQFCSYNSQSFLSSLATGQAGTLFEGECSQGG